MNLTNMKLGKRLGLGFGIVAAFTLILAAIAWWGLSSINQAMGTIQDEANKMSLAKDVNTQVDNIRLNIWKIVTSKDMAGKQDAKADIEKLREAYKKNMEVLKASATTETGKQLLANLEGTIAATRDVNNAIIDASYKGKDAEAVSLCAVEAAQKMAKIRIAMNEFIDWRTKRMTEASDAAQAIYVRIRWILVAAVCIIVAIAAYFGSTITHSVAFPISRVVLHFAEMAKGNFSIDVSKHATSRSDEMGDLARAMQSMQENLRKLVHDVTSGVQTLASSSTELSTISGQTAAGVKDASARVSTVAAAAEESSTNTVSVAASMEQASTNLASVASATEEMSATVGDIASNSEKARSISEQAMAQAQSISVLMQHLGKSAQEIGKVTETITNISSQTNLLALNATIEAARAGAAGKGFAVVANEIKELARQTATATEDIKNKISSVQNSAGGAIADIEKIAAVIKDVGGIVANIAAAIEEQATVTKDVAANIAQASAGVNDANQRVAQTASVSKSMAQDIAALNSTVGEIRQGGEQVQTSAAELSRLAEHLSALVAQFKIKAG